MTIKSYDRFLPNSILILLPPWGCWGKHCPQGQCWGGTLLFHTWPASKYKFSGSCTRQPKILLSKYLGGLVRVGCANFEAKDELSISVEALVRENHQLEAQQVVRVGKLCLTRLWQLQFIDILHKTVQLNRWNDCEAKLSHLSYSELCRARLLLVARPGLGSFFLLLF